MPESGSRNNAAVVVNSAGVMIRYTFYLMGAAAFALISLSLLKVFSFVSANRVVAKEEPPSFRLVDNELAKLTMWTQVVDGAMGRIETRHYGRQYDRGTNLTVTLSVRPPLRHNVDVVPTFADVRNTLAYASYGSGTTHYDLDTRFGPIRAVETRISADGLIKPCLSFQSRFETADVRLHGTFCEAAGAKPIAHRLACILDSLVLDTKLTSEEADRFLHYRIAHPVMCTATPVSQTMDTQSPRPLSPPARWSTPSANRR
jgi:hypothetical protein